MEFIEVIESKEEKDEGFQPRTYDFVVLGEVFNKGNLSDIMTFKLKTDFNYFKSNITKFIFKIN